MLCYQVINYFLLLVYMPYLLVKGKGKDKDCYAVVNSVTGKIHAKCSTKQKAMAQIRLLSSLYYLE